MAGFCLMILLCGIFSCCTAHSISMSDTSTRQRRLERLEEVLPSTVFLKWYKEDQITHSDEWHVDRENQVCVICLEVIQDIHLIRALSCRHVFHGQCFDQWFTDFHEYCPLCHCIVLTEEDAAA
ncbi:hypothetical protein IQ06DRAFT_150030 [Phaeosphaeriaceae sp. SRC1lsM3a]|nr:hypothetical protein IQ06DRAFT_150030 [Stagonospora sp. SRC1lsM3a]